VERTVKPIAARVGLPSRTVRYYDRIGLVSPDRSEAGYRLYGPEEEGKLRFVRQAKTLGFSLEEIRHLLDAAERGCCGEVMPEVRRLLDDKIAAIDAQMADLARFRSRLMAYREGPGDGCGCGNGGGAFCGCLDGASLIQIEQRR
jgi:DNA-binding transcriptional MerR regulator